MRANLRDSWLTLRAIGCGGCKTFGNHTAGCGDKQAPDLILRRSLQSTIIESSWVATGKTRGPGSARFHIMRRTSQGSFENRWKWATSADSVVKFFFLVVDFWFLEDGGLEDLFFADLLTMIGG